MNVWRNLMLVVWTVGIAACTAFFISYQALQSTILDREKAKTWLAESSTYEQLRDEVMVARVKAVVDEKLPGNSLIDAPLIRSVVGEVFPRAELVERTEPIIDSTYAWLDSKEPSVAFDIPLTDTRSQFYRSLEVKLGNKIGSLADCGDYRYPPEEALLSDLCIPAYVTAKEATQAAMGYIRAGDFPLGDSITEESFVLPSESVATLRRLPTYLNYLWALHLLVIAVSVIIIAGLLWSRRAAGMITIGAGIALGAATAWFSAGRISKYTFDGTEGIGVVIASAIDTLLPKMVTTMSWYALYGVLVGMAIIGVGYVWHRGRSNGSS